MERKITILNPTDNNLNTKYPVGSKLVARKNKASKFDEHQIDVYDGATKVGVVAAKPTTKAPDTETNVQIWDDVEDEFDLTVIEHATVRFKNGLKNVLVCSITTNSSTAAEVKDSFIFVKGKIKGSTTKYPAKLKVIESFGKGKTYVSAKMNEAEDKIEMFYNDEPSGYLDETSVEAEDYKTLKLLLSKEDTAEAKVTYSTKTAYNVEFSINSRVFEESKIETMKESLADIKANLVSVGYEEEELNAIEDYLYSIGFNASEVAEIYSTYRDLGEYDEEAKSQIPKKPSNLFVDTFDGLRTAYATIMEQLHILCSGEKGLGKNCFVETIAWIFQRPLWGIAINRDTDKIDICGSKSIDCEETKNGIMEKVIFVPEILVKAMKNGGFINIDEINFGHPGVLGLLHSIADDRRQVEIPGYGLVKAHANFCIVGTMNVGYAGTYELNDALADRFVDIMFPANNSIFDILENIFPDYPKSELQKADKVYQRMHDILESRGTELEDKNLTVRGFIQAIRLSKRLPLKKALTICVADKSKDFQYNANIREIIDALV